MNQPLVQNAANVRQVNRAKDREENAREKELSELRSLLDVKEFRTFLWRLMGKCRVNQSVWSPSAQIHYFSGQQDIGHFILAEICAADEDGYLKMMKENKETKNG